MVNLWEESYRHGCAMWDIEKPSMHLTGNVELFDMKESLDICSGPGNDMVFLAKHGSATGIDVSITALRNARKNAAENRVQANFVLGNFLHMPFRKDAFTFVNDRGCFHHVNPRDRKNFSCEVSRVMKKKARYLMQGFCKKEKLVLGPKKLSEKEIKDTFSQMKVISLKEDQMDETFRRINAYVLIAEK